jgi:hypothetical protein
MNLLSFLSLLLGAMCLIGFATLIYCAKTAPNGHEDADGFRLGAEPVSSRQRPVNGFAGNNEPAVRLAESA